MRKKKLLNYKDRALARFGIKSIKKLKDLNKKLNKTLSKSTKLRNELGI